jgi:OOP family OmpA-OmpF porin
MQVIFPKNIYYRKSGRKENIMKKIGILTVVMMLIAVVSTAQAEVRAGSFSVTPFIGGYVFEGNEDYKNTASIGLRAGYNFTKNLGVEGFFNYAQTEMENVPGKYNLDIWLRY